MKTVSGLGFTGHSVLPSIQELPENTGNVEYVGEVGGVRGEEMRETRKQGRACPRVTVHSFSARRKGHGPTRLRVRSRKGLSGGTLL